MALYPVRKVGGVAIIDLSGAFDIPRDDDLRETVKKLLAAGTRNIILNMQEVTHMGSVGLGEIARTYTATRHNGSHIKLLAPQKSVRALLAVTKLLTVFEIHETEAEAIASF